MKPLKNYLLIVAIVLASSTILEAQYASPMPASSPAIPADNSSKGYIGISVGAAIPLGAFGNKTGDPLTTDGYANPGGMFDVSFGYKLGQNLGIAGMIHGQSNPMDGAAIVNQFGGSGNGFSVTSSAGNWAIGGLLVGGYGSFPIGTSTTVIDIRALIGFMHATSPQVSITTNDGVTIQTITISSATSTAFSTLLGVGFRFKLGGNFCLLTNLDYCSSSPQFNNAQLSGVGSSFPVPGFTTSVSTMNVSVGIGYKL